MQLFSILNNSNKKVIEITMIKKNKIVVTGGTGRFAENLKKN